ncbi:putative aminotransferase [Lojkania enalia]|uniref:Aminotransferase n=1 Tax=Lojkania enalia TaxID=147567 RepID=A0A9P4N2Z1_9PLEO|nr:putative aminotransferase [Didymosphaeria enalia]
MEATPIGENLSFRIRSQKIDAQSRRNQDIFTRNLTEALDMRRTNQSFFLALQNTWQVSNAVDFSSNDILSLGSSGILRTEFLSELAKYPDFTPGACGSRVIDGNSLYLEETERRIADYHGAETGLVVSSGFEGNVAIWSAIPRLGDVIVYDALVHASTREGMNQSLAMARKEFTHNNVESFRSTLLSIADSQPLIRQGKRCVIVAVESVYSMDGDICPLQELVDVAREVFSEAKGIVQFVVDEAHSTGILGKQGKGLVSELGLEKDIAIRLHTFGKAMCSSGAIVMGSSTVRAALINFSKSVIFSTAPSFPFVAAIRAGYNILPTPEVDQARSHVQHLTRTFFSFITSHPLWKTAQDLSILRIPLATSDWEAQPFMTHIAPIRTKEPYHYWLFFHLTFAGFSVFPVDYPTVPKGETRLKISFHAKNSVEEVKCLVDSLFEFVHEVIEMQEGVEWKNEVPRAASQVYDWMEKEKLVGFGRP